METRYYVIWKYVIRVAHIFYQTSSTSNIDYRPTSPQVVPVTSSRREIQTIFNSWITYYPYLKYLAK
jgi:hypothetical protein